MGAIYYLYFWALRTSYSDPDVSCGKSNWSILLIVTVVFSIMTLFTMTALVLIARSGISFIKLNPLQRFAHSIAGATILICGLIMIMGMDL